VPDLLNLKTPHFELSVWAKDVEASQALLDKTHTNRNIDVPRSSIRFSPALNVLEVTPPTKEPLTEQPSSELTLPELLFFENKQYEFEFLFFIGVNTTTHSPAIIHRLRNVEESFHYKRGSLRGSVNFSNDIGWFRLGLRYQIAGREVIQYLSFEVQPVKMAMAHDLEGIHSTIDAYYPLWRFSFVQKTDQELAKSRKPHERFQLLWLAHFQRLRTDLEAGIKRICNAPHTRLLPYQHHVRAERLRGRLSAKLEERVTGHIVSGETQHHYQITRQRLSLDTPENRFIKMVLTRCSQDIARFKKRAEQEDSLRKNGGRLSGAFFTELDQWKRPLDQLLNRPLFAEVGAFDGQTSESLVLHQRNGYSGVYRIWQELKLYLDLFGSHANISMKSVAELYEVWCLLEIRRLLLDLGFTEKIHHHALLKNNGMEKSLKDGIGAAFHLERADGIKIRLAHEPIFLRTNNPSFGKIYSWTTVQKPDIFLEATFKDKERVQWIFDAKYRIADDEKGNNLAPDDAINQMHRYRDALIYINEANDGEPEKSRPILGAFVLYPGWFDEANTINPYQDAIEAVGIGGFPLLPGRDNQWLRDFLVGRFGDRNVTYPIAEADQYFIEESARIGTMGMQHVRYSDLTLAAPMGPIKGRDKDYLQRFKEGLAGWYHIRLSTTEKKSIARITMREVRYCAIAVYHGGGAERIITHIYEVKSVKLVKRCDMDIHQAGKVDSGNDKEYWLFELGYSRPLVQPLSMTGLRTFKFQLTKAKELLVSKNWDDLQKRYAMVS
jgi:hypothetical protein